MKIFIIQLFVLASVAANEDYSSEITTHKLLISEDYNELASSKGESNYYTDFDEIEYEQRVEDIRSTANYIITAVIAFSLVGSICALIILIHFKSKKRSRLMNLM